jgi:steroid delta-isomerase
MTTPEHVSDVVDRYCKAEADKDREAWLALFAPDATQEDPVGAPANRGHEALGTFFDATAAKMDIALSQTAPPIVAGDEAIAFLQVHIGAGPERVLLAPIVEHLVFDGSGLITSLRAFLDPASARPDPE